MEAHSNYFDISHSVSYPTDYDNGKIDFPYKDVVEEEEDNDGNTLKKIKEDTKITNSDATSTIIKAIVGFGIVNLPYIFRTLGIFPCLGVILAIPLIEYSSIASLLECKNITKKYGYSMYAKICFGTMGSIFIKFLIMAEAFGCCCAHLKIFGETILSIIKLFFNFNYSFFNNEKLYSFVIFIFLCPFVIKKEISSLKNVAFIGVIFNIIFLITIIALYAYKYLTKTVPPFNRFLLFPKFQFIEIFTSVAALLEAFSYQSIVFSVYISLEHRSNKTMKRLTQNSLAFCTILYILTGVFCVLMYSDKINESIIINFREDIIFYKGKSYLAIIILLLGQFSLLVSSLFNFPLTFYALKKNFINLYIMILKKVKQDKGKADKTKQLTDFEVKQDSSTLGPTARIVINLMLYFFVLLIVLLIDQVISICTFVGSTCSNVIIVLAPHAFVIILSKTPICTLNKLKEKFIFIIGILTMIGFLYVEIRKLIF